MIGEGTLHGNGSRNGVGGTCEGYKESITLHIYLRAVALIENRAQHLPEVGQHIGVVLTQLLQEARGSFNVGEEEGDGSRREITQSGPFLLALGYVSRRGS